MTWSRSDAKCISYQIQNYTLLTNSSKLKTQIFCSPLFDWIPVVLFLDLRQWLLFDVPKTNHITHDIICKLFFLYCAIEPFLPLLPVPLFVVSKTWKLLEMFRIKMFFFLLFESIGNFKEFLLSVSRSTDSLYSKTSTEYQFTVYHYYQKLFIIPIVFDAIYLIVFVFLPKTQNERWTSTYNYEPCMLNNNNFVSVTVQPVFDSSPFL